MANDVLDEAYERFEGTGPEWGGNLSNHGPMAAEVLARRGFGEAVPGWVGSYLQRLDELPAPQGAITETNWPQALGEFVRIADWTAYFSRRLTEQSWRTVLVDWWPRLLPGVAAGATHGLIRTSHALRTVLAGDQSAAARSELARGLAFWAARATKIPSVTDPGGTLGAGAALQGVPQLAEQDGPVAVRLARLADVPGWPAALRALRAPAEPSDVPGRLADLVDAATLRYFTHGYASPVLLVHTATAPNAMLHALPALPTRYWRASLTAAWAASAALTAGYGPIQGTPPNRLPSPPADSDPVGEILHRAVGHGDEHVIKFTDTAAEVYTRTGDPVALAAAVRNRELIPGPT